MPRKLLFLIILLALSLSAIAQRQRNYIYIFDCTQSMEWKGIWDPAKTALDRTIEVQRVQPDASFTVIPFQGVVHKGYSFGAADYPAVKSEMTGALDEYIKTKTNTNIADALSEGLRGCKDNMENRVYLLTDGNDNVKGPAEVCRIIRKWCADHRNTRFFYVTLADEAVDPEIVKAINECPDAFFISCHEGIIPQLADISPSKIHASTLELDAVHRLSFSEPGVYPLRAECYDPWFEPVVSGDRADNQSITVGLKLKREMTPEELNEALAPDTDADGNYTFSFKILSATADVVVVNPKVTVVMSNRPQRKLTLCGGRFDELVVKPGSSSYPSFLFSDEKLPDTVYVDLQPEFSSTAEANTSATFEIAADKGEPTDFTLIYNDMPVDDDGRIDIRRDSPAILGVVFDKNASTGRRYFSFTPVASRELELINGYPIDELPEMTIRTSYSRDWNPLATLCFWLGVAILAALVLWFVVLRPIFYPKFKIVALSFAGPKGYYVRKRVRKYRGVVLTSRRREQGFFSKLFTGSILYISAPHWSPELTITPGNKKTCRVASQKSWDVVPSRTLKQHEEYEFINNVTGDKSKLTVE